MSKNLILSAAIGYKFNQLEFFIKSLRNYYKDTVTFLIGNNDHDLEDNLNIIPSSNQFSTIVPANGYLIIWFDKDQDQGPLHIGEKLSADGEGVYLYNAERVLIDSVTFGVQETDISMGRYPDGSDRWVKFTTPTPAKSNN